MASRESRAVVRGSAHRRRQSKERPPNLSDVTPLRIVLLGKSVSENSGVGNFILGRAAFDSEAPPDVIERVGGRLKNRHVIIINSPQLLQTNISDHQITQTVRECMYLSDPGPHVIVLLLKHEQCSTKDQEHVEKVLLSFSERVYQHIMVLSKQEPTETNDILQKIIQKCANRHFSLQRSSSPDDLLQAFEDMVQINDGRHLVCAEASQYFTIEKQSTGRFSEGMKLNLVVCGSERTLKSSISEWILQQTDRRSDMELHGRLISLVELPTLTRLSEKEVMHQTHQSVSLCHPGVHVFLLIIPDASLTDKDKAEMEEIQRIFSSRINKHIMILRIKEKNVISKLFSSNSSLRNISSTQVCLQSFGGRQFVLENVSQISDLLQNVENMVQENGGSYYTTFMYLQARVELERNKHRAEIEELRRSMMKTQSTADVTHGDLRIVLLGKVGVGKSATGNIILRKKAFKSTIQSKSVTRECQKETSEFNRRRITVIDTPGLFDTGVDNVETRKEIVKCVSMAAPGPHVFLLVIPLGRFTQEEKDAVKMIQEMFGEKSRMYTVVLFTRGDYLKGTTIEDFIEDDDNLKNLIHKCGKRYHVFNNNETKDQRQVSALLDKIDCMVAANGGSFYTSEMFQQVEKNIKEEQERILKEKEEEIKRKEEELRAKYEAEIEQMKQENERERQEMQNELRKREEEFKKKEKEIRKETDENAQKELQRKLEEHKKFKEESKRKEKSLEEQQQNFIKHMDEKHEKEKQNLQEKIQHETREQAELEYLIKLEREVDKALQEQVETNVRERQDRIIKKKEEEIKRKEEELRAKCETETETIKNENKRERQEMPNELIRSQEEFKKREEEFKKETDENLQKDLQRKLEEKQKLFEQHKSILLRTTELTDQPERLAECLRELGNRLEELSTLQSLLEQPRGWRYYTAIRIASGRFFGSFQNIVNWIIGSHSKR